MSLADIDRSHLWHPFAPMAEWMSEPPLIIERAQGCNLMDSEGRAYLDGCSSLWVNIHGHNHPALNAAITEQLAKVAHTTLLGLGSPPSILLAQRLISLAPTGLSRVFYSDSGSTAVEVALKMAFQYQQLRGQIRRTKFLALTNAYHGDTLGAVAVGGIDAFHKIFNPLLTHTYRTPPDVGSLRRILERHGREIAAFILEPLVQGAAGMLIQPPGFLAEAARLCQQHGVLLIADEVATGFGRTGTLFACEQQNVRPDLMCVAKGLSGGYLPLAATLTTNDVFTQFLGAPGDQLTFFHGHSFTGNPLACAAALASLDLMERDQVMTMLQPKIVQLKRRLAGLILPLPHVAEIRQTGFMVGIELKRNRSEPYDPSLMIGARACRWARASGVILRPLGPIVVLMPPLSIAADELDWLVAATASAIDAATTEPRQATPLPPAAPTVVSRPTLPAAPCGLFVVGTDTGVGKTTFARALLSLARSRGFRLLPRKPVETGVLDQPADAVHLHRAAGSTSALAEVCPFPFAAALAPSIAAQQAGHASLTLRQLTDAVLRPSGTATPFLVEAAGGLLTPYAPLLSAADLAAALRLPLVLIARNALGTINHTALAVAEITRRALPLTGFILVETQPHQRDESRSTNAAAITQLTGARCLGTFPFVAPTGDPKADDQNLAAALEDSIHLGPIFAAMGLR